MNKLEKMRAESSGELERSEAEAPLQTEEKEERKFFSLFTFWKKLKKEGVEEIEEENDDTQKKGFKKYLNARTAVLTASVLIIAVAGYVNVKFSVPPTNSDDLINGISMNALSPENLDTENVNVENEAEDYFALSVINRERVRDEAMEMLLDLTNSDAVDAVAKLDAYTEMTRMANEITNEANIESLVKAKGFNNCVAVVSGEDVNVVVESEGLSLNQVAQIKEIVYLECGVHPDNIKIIEKSGV